MRQSKAEIYERTLQGIIALCSERRSQMAAVILNNIQAAAQQAIHKAAGM